MSPATKERVDQGTGTGLGAPWNVVVLNDDHNTFEGVAFALSATIPGLSYDQGMALAYVPDFRGVLSSRIWVSHFGRQG